jgi:hypothetical protein
MYRCPRTGWAVTGPDAADKLRLRQPDPDALEVVSYLWQEYQYRHDMVWQLAFRITAVAAALLIAPFLADVWVVRAVGNGLAGLPILAIVVILGGWFTLGSELPRLKLIRSAYQGAQVRVLGPYLSANELRRMGPKPEKSDKSEGNKPFREWLSAWFGWHHFEQRVRLYFLVLLVAAIIYLVVLLGSLDAVIEEAERSQ